MYIYIYIYGKIKEYTKVHATYTAGTKNNSLYQQDPNQSIKSKALSIF